MQTVVEKIHDGINFVGLHVFLSQKYGVIVGKKSGDDRKIECPMHRPRHTRSAWIHAWPNRNQTFMCGKCLDKPVDVIDLMIVLGEAEARGEAIQKLASDLVV